jgi:haloacetate dehalogenase
MTAERDLFAGSAEQRLNTGGAEIFLRLAGSGPPLLLLHGHPQTRVCWHKTAAELARQSTPVLADLCGYDAGSVPPDQGCHLGDAKRTTVQDCLAVMRALGQQRIMVGGHDRGGRVAYRLALDHPEAVIALPPIDIILTAEIWRRLTAESATTSYHCGFLAQPAPLPERLIGGDPQFNLEHTLKSWSKPGDLSPFSSEALQHNHALLQDGARVHASCQDDRAGAGIDCLFDEADVRVGRKIGCPTFPVWGSDDPGKRDLKPLEIWRGWCSELSAANVDSGHYLAEENPGATFAALLPFITARGGAQ